MDLIARWLKGAGPPWTGGLVVGAVMGWALLTQSFVVVVFVAFAWLGWALQSRQKAAFAGLLLGQGAGSFALAWRTAGQVQTSTWLALAVALILVGGGATWLAWRAREGAGSRMTGFRTSAGLIGAAIVAAMLVAWVGLPLRPGEYALPTRQTPEWLGAGCAGVGLDAVVRGDPNDPRIVWLENRLPDSVASGASRLEASWPAGYRARFTPGLEVIDGFGIVVRRDGDAVTGACGSDQTGDVYSLAPPFN